MSGRSRQIKIEILGDARDAQKAFDALEKSAGGFGEHLKNVASIAGGFIVAQGLMRLPDLFSAAVDAGSNLEESINAVNQIFRESADQILEWGETQANSFGLSQRAFNDLAVPLGALLKNVGLDLDTVAGYTIELTERAADMASVFNTDVDEALSAIQAGLRGQADPLERYGVSLTAARVEAHALAMTGKELTSELTDQEKMLARVDLILQQTADTAGDFKSTSDGVANSARIMAARQEELAAVIGMQLLPVQQAVNRAKLEFLELLAVHVIPAVINLTNAIKDRLRPEIEKFIKGPLKDIIGTFEDFRELIGASLEGDLQNAADAFARLPGPLRDIGMAVWGIGSFIREDALPALQTLRDTLSGISLSDITWENAQALADSLVTAVRDVDWNGVRETITDQIFDGIEIASDTAQSFVDEIDAQLEQVDWSAVQESIREGVLSGLDAASSAVSGAASAGEQIQTWLVSEIEAVEDWARLGAAVKGGVITGITAASGIAGLTVALIDWIAAEITDGEGDWSTIASNIGKKIGDAFGEAVTIGQQIIDWVSRSLEDVDWQAVADSIASGISTAISTATSIAQAIADSIANNIDKVDWSRLTWDSAAGQMTVGLGESLTRALTDELAKIDLEGALRDAGLVLTPEALFGEGGLTDTLAELSDALNEIATVLREDLGPTIEEAREAWEEWEPILRPLLGLILDVTLALGTTLINVALMPLIRMLRETAMALDVMFWALQNIAQGAEVVGGWLQRLEGPFQSLISYTQESASSLLGWAEISIGAVEGFADGTIGHLHRWLESAKANFANYVAMSASSLGTWVATSIGYASQFSYEMLNTLARWAQESSDTANRFLYGVLNKLAELVTRGVQELNNFVNGAADELAALPGRARDAVGDLSTVLWDAGKELIDGLIDGIKSAMPDLEGTLNWVTDKIPDWKGPLERDRLLLRPTGVAIMEGLVEGVRDGTPPLVAELEQITRTIEATADEWLGALRSLDDIASGDAQQRLQERLQSLNEMLRAALEAGAPEEVLDKILADIAAVEAEIALVMEIAGTSMVESLRQQQLAEQMAEEARKAAEEAARAMAEEWERRTENLLDPEGTVARLESDLAEIAAKIAAGEAGGAPQAVLDAWQKKQQELEKESRQFWEDMARKAASGLVDPKVLAEIGAAGNAQFQEYLEEFAGADRAREITEAVGELARKPLDELRKRFEEAPELAGQFVDDLVRGVERGQWAWEDVIDVLGVLPRQKLIPILEELAAKFEVDLLEAMLAADAGAQILAQNGLDAISAALEEITTKASDAKSALDSLPNAKDYQAPGDQSPGGGGPGGGGPGGGGGTQREGPVGLTGEGGIVVNSDMARTGPEFVIVYFPEGSDKPRIYRVSDSADPVTLINFMAIADGLGQNVFYHGGIYGTKGARPPGVWAQAIINRVTNVGGMAAGSQLKTYAEARGLELKGPVLSLTESGAAGPPGTQQSQQDQHSGPGANITINITAKSSDPQEIAAETEAAMQFAAMAPELVTVTGA